MRRWLIVVLAGLSFSASLILTLSTAESRDFNLRGYSDPTRDKNLPYRIPRLGVNVSLLNEDPDALRDHFDRMRAIGVTWIRQFVYWDQIEPVPGQYNWSQWDQLIEEISHFPDLEILAVLMNSPQWAQRSGSRGHPTSPPAEPQHFARFAEAFALRYGENIHFYQIWDEPNLDDAWGNTDPRPAAYAALLSVAYDAIHSADSTATVMAAALAPTIERSGANISDWRYLETLYELGMAQYMDAVAGKPYGFNRSPTDRIISEDTLNFSRIIRLREIMVANGDADKHLWASAWGWNSLPEDWIGQDSIWGQATAEEQLNHTLNALYRAEREWPWLGGMILQHWQPNAPLDDAVWGFSLIGPDNQPTPLYETLLSKTGSHNAASNGLFHPANAYTTYSGVWTFGPLGADIGWLGTSDSRFRFDFFGTDIALLVRKGDFFATLYATIDDQPANALPQDNQGNSYLMLRSADLQTSMELVDVGTNLPLESHSLEVVADKGWDRWALAGVATSSGNLAKPYDQQLAIGAFSTMATGLALVLALLRVPWKWAQPYLSSLKDLTFRGLDWLLGIIAAIFLVLGMVLAWGDAVPAILRKEAIQNSLGFLVTGGLIALEPGFILAIVATVVLFWLIYHNTLLGLSLVIVFAPFYLFPVELYLFAFPVVEILILITFAAWLLRLAIRWAKSRPNRGDRPAVGANISLYLQRLHSLDYVAAAWLVLGLVALMWSTRQGTAFTEYRTVFVEPFLFYVLVRAQPDRAALRRLIDALIVAGTLVAVIGLFQYIRGEAIITAEEGARRLASVYGSPNNVALFLGRALPFATAFVLLNVKLAQRVLYGAAILLMLGAAVLTQSIGGLLLGIPAGTIIVILLLGRRKAIFPLVVLGVIAVLFVVGFSQASPRFANLLDWTQGTNFLRLRVWESSWDVIGNQPVTGLGLDQFLYEYRTTYIRPDAIWDPDLSHPHNILLDFWIRLGAPGVVLLLCSQIVFWRSIWTHLSFHEYRNGISGRLDRSIIVGTAGSMAALVAHGLIDNSVFVIDLAFVFLLLLSIPALLHN